jgi:hypothetical protein
MKTSDAFCANCQQQTEHAVTIDANNEMVFTCDCGRFFKLNPEGLSKDDVQAALDQHHAANEGQLPMEQIEAAQSALLDELL